MEFPKGCPPQRSAQGGVCGPARHELLDATHGGVVDLFANAAWLDTDSANGEGFISLIFRGKLKRNVLCGKPAS